jgi:uncharacterized protein YbjT (DUF2867 family)
MFAILGVSGHIGSVVAETLLAQSKPVRVLVRDAAKGATWQARGAEVAVADVGDAAALTRAFTGATGVFVLLPPSVTTPDPLGENRARVDSIAKAVRAAKVGHVVLLSSIGAQHADGNGPIKALHIAETELAATGAALTALRPAYFMENWLGSLSALPQGVLPTFVPPDLVFPQIATRDIGRAAARALVEGGHGTQIIELAGPRDYSSIDVAAVLAKLTGKPVVATAAPLDAVVPTFTSFGMSRASALLYREMYAGMISGVVAYDGKGRLVRGTVPVEDVLGPALPRG